MTNVQAKKAHLQLTNFGVPIPKKIVTSLLSKIFPFYWAYAKRKKGYNMKYY